MTGTGREIIPASIAPLKTNCTATAARSSPITRVATRIPDSPSRAKTRSPARSIIHEISIVAMIDACTMSFDIGADACAPSTITVDMAPGPASIGIPRGVIPTSSFCSPSTSSSVPSWVVRFARSMSIATSQSMNPPAIRNAGSVTPNILRITSPADANMRSVIPAAMQAALAVFFRRSASSPRVKARYAGTTAIGSTRKRIDVNVTNANWPRSLNAEPERRMETLSTPISL